MLYEERGITVWEFPFFTVLNLKGVLIKIAIAGLDEEAETDHAHEILIFD